MSFDELFQALILTNIFVIFLKNKIKILAKYENN